MISQNIRNYIFGPVYVALTNGNIVEVARTVKVDGLQFSIILLHPRNEAKFGSDQSNNLSNEPYWVISANGSTIIFQNLDEISQNSDTSCFEIAK